MGRKDVDADAAEGYRVQHAERPRVGELLFHVMLDGSATAVPEADAAAEPSDSTADSAEEAGGAPTETAAEIELAQ